MSKAESISTIRDLIDYGFSYVDFYDSYLITNALVGWKKFLSEPSFYKEWWVDLDRSDRSIGYQTLAREDRGIEIFKANYSLQKLVEENGFDYSKYKDWLLNFIFLRSACKELCLRAVESLCQELDYEFFRVEGKLVSNYFLTLEKYPPTEEYFSIKPHQDENFLTIQLYADSENFLFGTNCQVPYLVPSPNKALVFFGKKATALFPKLKAMTHGIKNNSPDQSLTISFSIG